jgi:hypothetical protein
MMPTLVDAQLELDAGAELGEGPVWDPCTACLYFVDILQGRIHRYHPESRSLATYTIRQSAGALAPTEAGDLVVAVRDGFGRLDLGTRHFTMLATVDADRPELRMNDGNCDAAGRFWAGTMALDERAGAGALYRLSVSRQVDRVLSEVTISNGIDWTGDSRKQGNSTNVPSTTMRLTVSSAAASSNWSRAETRRSSFISMLLFLGAGLQVDLVDDRPVLDEVVEGRNAIQSAEAALLKTALLGLVVNNRPVVDPDRPDLKSRASLRQEKGQRFPSPVCGTPRPSS